MPKKYLEGFVSLYMIPIYGLGTLFIFEPLSFMISNCFWLFRFIFWGISFVIAEFILGYIFNKIFKFYPWDWYEPSKYKIFKKAYSLWSYLPLWGLWVLLLERIVKIIYNISSYI